MADWHLDDLRKALANGGWKLLAIHDGDGRAISGSWEIQRSTRKAPAMIDFDGLDDLSCLPMNESYACHVRGGGPSLYFSKPGPKWREELTAFVHALNRES